MWLQEQFLPRVEGAGEPKAPSFSRSEGEGWGVVLWLWI